MLQGFPDDLSDVLDSGIDLVELVGYEEVENIAKVVITTRHWLKPGHEARANLAGVLFDNCRMLLEQYDAVDKPIDEEGALPPDALTRFARYLWTAQALADDSVAERVEAVVPPSLREQCLERAKRARLLHPNGPSSGGFLTPGMN